MKHPAAACISPSSSARLSQLRRLRRGSIALAVAAALPSARAADIWLDNSNGNWSTSANWSDKSGAPTGATAVAQFGSVSRTSISTSSDVTIGTLAFVSAPAYTFTLGQDTTFSLLGAGIQLTSSSSPLLVANTANIVFGSSDAGSPSTSAASARLMAQNGGTITFNGTATNADAQLSVDGSSFATFNDSTTAGSSLAVLTNNGSIIFNSNANAGAATINTGAGATTYFQGNSSAQNATLNVSGTADLVGSVVFLESASAGNSKLVIGANAQATFQSLATAGSATIHVQSNGSVSFLEFSYRRQCCIDCRWRLDGRPLRADDHPGQLRFNPGQWSV